MSEADFYRAFAAILDAGSLSDPMFRFLPPDPIRDDRTMDALADLGRRLAGGRDGGRRMRDDGEQDRARSS